MGLISRWVEVARAVGLAPAIGCWSDGGQQAWFRLDGAGDLIARRYSSVAATGAPVPAALRLWGIHGAHQLALTIRYQPQLQRWVSPVRSGLPAIGRRLPVCRISLDLTLCPAEMTRRQPAPWTHADPSHVRLSREFSRVLPDPRVAMALSIGEGEPLEEAIDRHQGDLRSAIDSGWLSVFQPSTMISRLLDEAPTLALSPEHPPVDPSHPPALLGVLDLPPRRTGLRAWLVSGRGPRALGGISVSLVVLGLGLLSQVPGVGGVVGTALVAAGQAAACGIRRRHPWSALGFIAILCSLGGAIVLGKLL